MCSLVEQKGYNSDELEILIDKLTNKYPFLNKLCFGGSISGRSLTALTIGNTKDLTLFVAAVHGNEYITATLLLSFVEDLCNAVSKNLLFCGIDFCRAFKENGVAFVPMLNPDGCDIVLNNVSKFCKTQINKVRKISGGDFSKWKSNLNGVDINHNFPADWERLRKIEISRGIETYSCGRFGGFSPSSEPETVAIMTLCKFLRPRSAIALHTQGEVIYYGYDRYNEAEIQMAEIFSMLSGYAISTPDYLSSCGGFKDWFAKEFKRPAFTIECGLGENPLPIENAAKIYKRIKETLAVASVM